MIRALLLVAVLASGAAQDAPVAIESVDAIRHLLPDPGPAPTAEIADQRAEKLSRALRCPVCQGLSVQDSPSHSAIAMKGLIHELVEAGYTDQQITDFFVERYGEWVLLEPRAHGLNWSLWLAPALLLLGGAAWVTASARGSAPPAPDELETPDDPYTRRILAALEEQPPAHTPPRAAEKD